MAVRVRRVALLFALSMILVVSEAVAQEQTADKSAGTANNLAGPLQELQRELDTLRAAGKTKEADELEQQAKVALNGLLVRFRQTQAQSIRQQDPATHRLQEVRQLVEQVRTEIGQAAAEPLTKRLAAIEQSLKSGEAFTDEAEAREQEPEVHVLRIPAGVALPDGFVEGRDHRTVGYAEVELKYSARPIILALYSGRPTLWNIKRNGNELHAILRSHANQEILGAGDCPVLESNTSASIWQATGRVTATEQSVSSYDGSPLTIGPSNRVWLAHSLLPYIEAVATKAEARLTAHRVEPLKDLRFTAVHRYVTQQVGPTIVGNSFGEFTIAGPIANTLVPLEQRLATRIVTAGGEEPLRFALDSLGKLVMSEKKGQTFNPVPVAASLRVPGVFSSFCLDTRRNRLILAPRAPGGLCTYDIAKGKWAKLGDIKSTIAAIVYDAEVDKFYAIASQLRGVPTVHTPTELLHVDSGGAVAFRNKFPAEGITKNPRSSAVTMRSFGVAGLQLAMAGNNLALIYDGALAQTTDAPLKLLNPQTGALVYEGPIRVHQGEDPALVLNREEAPPAQANGWLARVDQSVDKAEQVKDRLAIEKPEQVEAFATRLAELKGIMRGQAAERDQEQLYSVSVWNNVNQPVEVHVSDTTGPSRLFLTSSQPNNQGVPIKWRVTVADGVKLKEITLVAAQDQLEKPPAAIAVRRGTPNQPAATTWASPDAIRFSMMTVNGQATRLTIGPENGQWRAEMATRELDRLIENSGIDLQSSQLAELEKHRFFAVTRVGRVQPFPFGQQQPAPKPSLFGEFTVRGPVRGTEKPVTLKPNDQILAVTKEHVYVLEHGRGFDVTFASIEVATDKRTSHASPPIRHSARDCRSAFDASRNRMYLASREGVQVLDLETMKWTPFATRQFGFNDSLAVYNPAADMFYQCDDSGIRGRLAKRYNWRGALLDTVPMHLVRTTRFHNQAVQTVSFGHYTAELQHANDQGTIRVTDLTNGDLVYQGTLRQHVDRKALSPDELSSIYAKLANKKPDSDELMWQMTAAHNDAVRFLDAKLPPPAVTQVDIVPLVRQLDSDDFAERDAAFKKLQKLGSEIEPVVRRALKAKLPTETKARLDRLIKTWESAAPQNGEERQHVNAVTVLRRVGSSPARALLREIANGRGSPVAQRAAREALEK